MHLAVDIGTASISGLVWQQPSLTRQKNRAGIKPDILEVVRVPLVNKEITHRLVPALKLFLARAETALGGRDPASVVIGLAAPYYQGRTAWVHKQFPRKIAVTSVLLDTLCAEAEQEHTRALSSEEELFCRDTLAVHCNGYPIDMRVCRAHAHHISVAVRFSSFRSALRKQIVGLFEDYYPNAQVRVTTFPAAFGRLLQYFPHGAEHAAVIDIGPVAGGVSECSFFHDGVLADVVTVPHGMGEEWKRLMRPIIAARLVQKPNLHFFLTGGGAMSEQARAAFSFLLQTIRFGNHTDIHPLSVMMFRDQFRRWPASLTSSLDVGLLTLLY